MLLLIVLRSHEHLGIRIGMPFVLHFYKANDITVEQWLCVQCHAHAIHHVLLRVGTIVD